jgi:molybdate transport system substrate-binding protein
VRLVLLLLALLVVAVPAARAQTVTVLAAASLTDAFVEIGRAWTAAGNPPLRFSFAASSALARQIEQGAPADVFASADEPWMDWLAARRLIVPDTRVAPIGNRLALVVPAASTAIVDLRPGFDLTALLGRDGRWVTGDPASVPAGRYAQHALTALGAWEAARTRLVRAENVRAALALVERGEVPAGIVYTTDAAVSRGVRVAGVFPEGSHPPVVYPMALVRESEAARRVLAFLTGPEARPVYERFGFSMR